MMSSLSILSSPCVLFAVLGSLQMCVHLCSSSPPGGSVISTTPPDEVPAAIRGSSTQRRPTQVSYAVHIAEFRVEKRAPVEPMQNRQSSINPTPSLVSSISRDPQTQLNAHSVSPSAPVTMVTAEVSVGDNSISDRAELKVGLNASDKTITSVKSTESYDNLHVHVTSSEVHNMETLSYVHMSSITPSTGQSSHSQNPMLLDASPSADVPVSKISSSPTEFVSLDLHQSPGGATPYLPRLNITKVPSGHHIDNSSQLNIVRGFFTSSILTSSDGVAFLDRQTVVSDLRSKPELSVTDHYIPSILISRSYNSPKEESSVHVHSGYHGNKHDVMVTTVHAVVPPTVTESLSSVYADQAVQSEALSDSGAIYTLNRGTEFIPPRTMSTTVTLGSGLYSTGIHASQSEQSLSSKVYPSVVAMETVPIETEIISQVISTSAVISETAVSASVLRSESEKSSKMYSYNLSPVSISVHPTSIENWMKSSYNVSGSVVIGGGQPDTSRVTTVTNVAKGMVYSTSNQQTSKRTTHKNEGYSERTKSNTSPSTMKGKEPTITTKKPSIILKTLPTKNPGIAVETIIPKTDSSITPKYSKLPLYLTVELKMKWPIFCSRQNEFKSLVAKSLKSKSSVNVESHQVILMKVIPCKTKRVSRRKAGIDVDFYISDVKGDYDFELTDKCAEMMVQGLFMKGTAFEDKMIGYHIHGKRVALETAATTQEENNKPKEGVIIAIVVASVAGVAFMALMALQVVVIKRKQRSKKKRKAYDASRPSLDGHSMDSVQLTAINRMREALAYTNPGMQMENEKNSLTHLVNFAGLDKFANDEEFLAEEFRSIPNYMPPLSEVPSGAEDKNRYANVIPVPQTRVALTELAGDPASTYINANYIKGYGGDERVYIATQAPLENTVADFWRMVWEQQVQVIVMLTLLDEKGLSKCAEYWPNTDGGDTVRLYGDHEVVLKEREIRQDFIISTLMLKEMELEESREVLHFWYTNWPAHRLPEPNLLLKFMLEVHPQMEENHGPTVVHCSPGTGRTGTFLAIDICIRQYNHKRTVDTPRTVNRLRTERGGCVQTRDQYIFIYKILNSYSTMLCNPSSSTSSSTSSLNEDEMAGFVNK